MGKSSFWSDPSLEPKRKYRWVFYMGGIPQWIVKKVNKPSFEMTESEHQYLNHTFYYPGRLKYSEATVTLVDPITPDAARTIMDIINASGYHFPENASDTSTLSKVRSVQALGYVTVEQIGAEGEAIDKWSYVNAWIKNVKFGELDYSSDDMVEIELTIRYDYAIMELPVAGTGGVEPANF